MAVTGVGRLLCAVMQGLLGPDTSESPFEVETPGRVADSSGSVQEVES